MAKVQHGHWTDGHDGDVVVFLIGMSINRWWRVDKWFPVFTAMPRMLAELFGTPGSGLLGARTLIGARGPTVVQYWASVDQLLAYAHDAEQQHRPAWQRYNAMTRRGAGAVGIWHETYVVPRGAHESIYGWTKPLGLAAATSSVPVGRRSETARQRLGHTTDET